jgi:hypothetical protein
MYEKTRSSILQRKGELLVDEIAELSAGEIIEATECLRAWRDEGIIEQ